MDNKFSVTLNYIGWATSYEHKHRRKTHYT